MTTTEDLKIDVKTLAGWLAKKIPVTIVDVRPKAEREEWLIPGSLHADAYDKLKADDQHALDDLNPQADIPVVTVCGSGRTSLKAAEILKQRGYDAYSLDGGMKAWNYAWNTAETMFHDVKVIQVRRSSKGVLSYIIGSADEAVVIDAALDPLVYLDIAKANGWTIRYVTDTHVHADFISRTRELASASMAKHLVIEKANVEYPFTPVRDGQLIKFGNAALEVIHTPGHTLESTSFRLDDDAIFTGDTLFVDGVGRPDLKANHDEAVERSRMLFRSLNQLLNLNQNAWILPAHTSVAVPFDNNLVTGTIKILKEKLDMLRLSETEFADYTMSRIPPTPPNYHTIAALNRQGSHEGYVPADLEAGANRCAIG
jgi:glyoxylase-like metal-dependent hydrolase (beta-lactamase superfamily II)